MRPLNSSLQAVLETSAHPEDFYINDGNKNIPNVYADSAISVCFLMLVRTRHFCTSVYLKGFSVRDAHALTFSSNWHKSYQTLKMPVSHYKEENQLTKLATSVRRVKSMTYVDSNQMLQAHLIKTKKNIEEDKLNSSQFPTPMIQTFNKSQ